MDEMGIGSVLSVPFGGESKIKSLQKDPLSDFKTALRESIDEMNGLFTEADRSASEMVLGKKDVHEAMIAMEQANLSLRLMIQVRNKVVAAYEEIMRMQF